MEGISVPTSQLDAVAVFKRKITENLPLLGYLDAESKENIWRYWKTVSSAVKIAVNGKGEFFHEQRKISKPLKASSENKAVLEQLDRKAVTIFIPKRYSKTGYRRYRILKYLNREKIADDVKVFIADGEDNSQIAEIDNESAWAYLANSVTGNVVKEEIVESADISNDDVHMEDENDFTLTIEEGNSSKNYETYVYQENPVQKQERLVQNQESPVQKQESPEQSPKKSNKVVWPVGQLITRSKSKKNSTSEDVKKALSKKIAKKSVKKSSCEPLQGADEKQASSTIECRSTVIASEKNSVSLKHHTSDIFESAESLQSPIKSNADNVRSAITPYESDKKTTRSSSLQKPEDIVVMEDKEHETRIITSLEADNQMTSANYDLSKGSGVDPAKTQQNTAVYSQSHKTSSDIEAIITALEEELDKRKADEEETKSGETIDDAKIVSSMSRTDYEETVSSDCDEQSPADYSQSHKTVSDIEVKIAALEEELNTSKAVEEENQSEESVGECPSTAKITDKDEVIEETVSSGCQEQNPAVEPQSHNSTSGIETMINVLEAELNNRKIDEEKTGSGEGIEEFSDAVEIPASDEVIEVQTLELENVVWTSDGHIQVLDHNVTISTSDVSISENQQPIDAGYDVVEYEVIGQKSNKRGKKKTQKSSWMGENGSDDRTCPVCHRVLSYSSSMAAHMRTHTGARPYSCGQCDRRFTTKANRDRHEATHVGLRPFACDTCGKCFTEKRSLQVHQRSHTGERPFVCQICGRGFTQKCTMLVHMDRHSDRKGHLCDLCGKAFRQKSQLDIHVKRHNRQAEFPCTECTVKCYTRGDLLRHQMKHTGERPYTCSQCPRTFTRKQYLIDHENVHFGRKPYQCSACGAAFHDMGSCHRHLRKHKMEEEEEEFKKNVELAQESLETKTEEPFVELSREDCRRIFKDIEIGQVLTLEDGSTAVLKAVVSEKDGSTVYHITCLNEESSQSENMDTTDTLNSDSLIDHSIIVDSEHNDKNIYKSF